MRDFRNEVRICVPRFWRAVDVLTQADMREIALRGPSLPPTAPAVLAGASSRCKTPLLCSALSTTQSVLSNGRKLRGRVERLVTGRLCLELNPHTDADIAQC